MTSAILILDFGSQYTQLIARRIREIGVYCEIWPWDMSSEDDIVHFKPRGIILSGGPESVTPKTARMRRRWCLTWMLPLLGICYGLHTMAAQLGGTVEPSDDKEFGYAQVRWTGTSRLLQDIEDHVDNEGNAAAGCLDEPWRQSHRTTGRVSSWWRSTDSAPVAAIADDGAAVTASSFILK